MDFRIEQRIDLGVELVAERLADESFIAATSALDPLADCRLLERTDAPPVTRLRIHRRFAASLPRAATAVVDPKRLTWVEEVVFDGSTQGGQHRIVPDHYPDLLVCSYKTTLSAAGSGSIRLATGSLRVKVLFGSGPVERAIVSGLREYADREAGLLGTWSPSTDR